jgi:hypothetical protein
MRCDTQSSPFFSKGEIFQFFKDEIPFFLNYFGIRCSSALFILQTEKKWTQLTLILTADGLQNSFF